MFLVFGAVLQIHDSHLTVATIMLCVAAAVWVIAFIHAACLVSSMATILTPRCPTTHYTLPLTPEYSLCVLCCSRPSELPQSSSSASGGEPGRRRSCSKTHELGYNGRGALLSAAAVFFVMLVWSVPLWTIFRCFGYSQLH